MKHTSLATLSAGLSGKVESIQAGSSATKRLYEMGFNTGAQVTMIKNDRGPIIVSLGGNKIALGRGLAEKMLVGQVQ